VGDDKEGRWLRGLFLKDGVGVERMRFSNTCGTNVCVILVDQASAQRSILCHRRTSPTDLTLSEADLAYIESARVLHLDGQFMPAAIEAAVRAQRTGVKVCYDGNHSRDQLEELLPLVDWLVVAESFPGEVTGESDLTIAAQMLVDLGPELVVVTKGAEGCQAWTQEGTWVSPGFAVQPVDTTGAGDAFHGGFIYGMLQGWEHAHVFRFANALAALNCLTLGGRRGLPRLEGVLEFLRSGSPPHRSYDSCLDKRSRAIS
jgi:ribokinase